jgi:hypothetical protein
MNTSTSTRLDIVAAVGLAIGGVFGLAGTFIGQASLQQSFWAIDAVGIVVATALLTMKYFRKGNDCVAAGFLVFVAAESLVLSNTAAGLTASVPSFGAGMALWSASLLMTSLPKTFAPRTRLAGSAAAVLFAITAGRIFWGEQVLPTAAPLPSLGYPFLVLTFVGWIWTLLRPDGPGQVTSVSSSVAR